MRLCWASVCCVEQSHLQNEVKTKMQICSSVFPAFCFRNLLIYSWGSEEIALFLLSQHSRASSVHVSGNYHRIQKCEITKGKCVEMLAIDDLGISLVWPVFPGRLMLFVFFFWGRTGELWAGRRVTCHITALMHKKGFSL